MKYFTSDWHLGEDRIGINNKPNLFYRPFKSVYEQDSVILNNFVSEFKNGDELYYLGDLIVGNEHLGEMQLRSLRKKFPNSNFHLIVGNYDEDKLDILKRYFDTAQNDLKLEIDNQKYYLNHYPSKCNTDNKNIINITGHIHGLWKVRKQLINVGVDAWHFKPVSIDEINFCWNAMNNFYDGNVFTDEK